MLTCYLIVWKEVGKLLDKVQYLQKQSHGILIGIAEIKCSLAGQTLLSPFSKRGERVWKLWPDFCDGRINLHGMYKIINLRGKKVSGSLYKWWWSIFVS